MMCTNPNLDLLVINAYTKFGEILSICSEDTCIGQKQNYDGWNDRRNDEWNDRQPKSNIAPAFSNRGNNETFCTCPMHTWYTLHYFELLANRKGNVYVLILYVLKPLLNARRG